MITSLRKSFYLAAIRRKLTSYYMKSTFLRMLRDNSTQLRHNRTVTALDGQTFSLTRTFFDNILSVFIVCSYLNW